MRFLHYTIIGFVLSAILVTGCSKKTEHPVELPKEESSISDPVTVSEKEKEPVNDPVVPERPVVEPIEPAVPVVEPPQEETTEANKPRTIELEPIDPQPVVPTVPLVPEPVDPIEAEDTLDTIPEKRGTGVGTQSPVNTQSPINTESPVKQDSPVKQGSTRTIPPLPSLSMLFSGAVSYILFLQVEAPAAEPPAMPPVPPEPDTAGEDLPPSIPEAMPEAKPEIDIDAPAVPTRPAEQQPDEPTAPSAEPMGQVLTPSTPEQNERTGQRETPSDGFRRLDSLSSQSVPPETLPNKIRFNFRYTPWKDVIEWFAEQAGLSLQADNVPSGSLNLTDNQYYSPTDALDVLNSYLLFKEYTILRKGKSMFVIYLPDGIPPNLLEPISPSELDDRGKYEICRCVFKLNRTTPEIIQAEAEKLLGPQGSIIALPKSQQIAITETAGTLRTIRDIIKRIDDPEELTAGTINIIEMQNLSADEALGIMRKLLAIEENDTSLRTAVDISGTKIWMSGRGDMVEKAKEMIKTIDGSYESKNPQLEGQPQFEVYDTGTADPAAVLAVLQTLLVGMPDVRLSLDTKTGGLAALGRPANHATIKETIKQMQLNVPQVEAIPLKRISPASAVESIKKFFATSSSSDITSTSASSGSRQTTTTGVPAPTVEADVTSRQIIVRGTESQIASIKSLLLQLGEDGNINRTMNQATIRSIPLSPAATALVLDQLKEVWSKVESSELKVVTPSAIVPSRSVNELQPKKENRPSTGFTESGSPVSGSPSRDSEPQDIQPNVDELIDTVFEKKVTEKSSNGSRYRQVKYQMETEHEPVYQPIGESVSEVPVQTKTAPVVVSAGPNGLMISSEDPAALDKLEELIQMLSDESVLGKTSLKIYYLKNSTAEVVSQTLSSLLGSGSSTSYGVSGSGTIDTPSFFEGEQRAEILGLLTLSNSIDKTGPVTITPDSRLNALMIQANPVDHKTIETLLPILDQAGTAEDIMIRPKARLITLNNMRAEDAKETVEDAFASRLQSGTGSAGSNNNRNNNRNNNSGRNNRGNQQQMPMPPMMGGMPGGPGMMLQQVMAQMSGRGNTSTAQEQEARMTLAVDSRSNSLIVTSPESLYLEVKEFVETLDEMAIQQETVVEVVNPKNVSTDLIRQTISNLAGDSVKFTTSQASTGSQSRSSGFSGFGSNTNRGGFSGFGGNTNRGGFGNFGGGANPFLNMMRGGFGGGNNRGGFGNRR